MAARAEPASRAAVLHAAASPPAGAIVSRFGEISPAFAAAFGARVDVGLLLGARTAEARAFSRSARPSRATSRGPLPVEIPTRRTLPASRVRTAVITGSND